MEHNMADLLYNLLPDEVIQELCTNVGIGADYDTMKSFLLKRFGITRNQDRARLMLKTFQLEPQSNQFESQLKELCSLVYDTAPKASPTTLFSFQQTLICQALAHDDKLWDLAYASKAVNHFELIDELVSYKRGKSNQRRSKPKNNSCRIHPNSKHTSSECRVLNNEKIQTKLPTKNRPFSNSQKDDGKEARCNQITISKSEPMNDLRIPVTVNQTDLSRKCVAYIDGGSQKTLILQKVATDLGLPLSKSNISIISFGDVVTPTKGSTNLQFTIGQHSYEFLFYIVESHPDPYSQIFLGNDFLASINADVLHRANGSALRINEDVIPNINLPLSSRGSSIQVNRVMTQSQDEVKTKICTDYPSVISKHKFDIGRCTVQLEPIVHKNQELPPFHKYDVPFKLRSEVQRQIAELVSHDIIRPTSTIPYCFNLETLTNQSSDFRLHKYIFKIQQFSPTIRWIPGQHNVVADALSRSFAIKSCSTSPHSSILRKEETLGTLPSDKLLLSTS
uniref:Reverse transcriptase n=1 Tax=Strongyloides papillosus TaxID=174720 RepID=A0A0N5C4X4_STREA